MIMKLPICEWESNGHHLGACCTRMERRTAGQGPRFISPHSTQNGLCPCFLKQPFSGTKAKVFAPLQSTHSSDTPSQFCHTLAILTYIYSTCTLKSPGGAKHHATLNHTVFALRGRRIILLRHLRACMRLSGLWREWCCQEERSPSTQRLQPSVWCPPQHTPLTTGSIKEQTECRWVFLRLLLSHPQSYHTHPAFNPCNNHSFLSHRLF